MTCQKISIHAPAKGATSMDDRLIRIETISIHAPAKGATPTQSSISAGHLHFNPRSREGSDSHAEFDICRAPAFQSTLPRRERLIFFAGCDILSLISIHAPAKGATLYVPREQHRREGISIHAPAKGATQYAATSPLISPDFNPRSREGSDWCKSSGKRGGHRFQSTLPRRERRSFRRYLAAVFLFQSTLPQRERLSVLFPISRWEGFQSTLPRRERLRAAGKARLLQEISIHAPAKGATTNSVTFSLSFLISIHAPAKGATGL